MSTSRNYANSPTLLLCTLTWGNNTRISTVNIYFSILCWKTTARVRTETACSCGSKEASSINRQSPCTSLQEMSRGQIIMMELAIWYPDSIPAILLTMFTPRFTDRMQDSNHPQSQDTINTPQCLPPGHHPHFFLGLHLILMGCGHGGCGRARSKKARRR